MHGWLCHAAMLTALSLPRAHVAAERQDPWAAADSAVPRLSPAAFPQLPRVIRRSLERRQCRIPQSYDTEKAHNVVQGRFRGQRRKDWAVLCSRGGLSTILVFRGGHAEQVDSLATSADRSYLQSMGAEGIVFSRHIDVADSQFIRSRANRDGGLLPAGPIHDGINDGFAGKGSVVRYWDGQRWVELPGAD